MTNENYLLVQGDSGELVEPGAWMRWTVKSERDISPIFQFVGKDLEGNLSMRSPKGNYTIERRSLKLSYRPNSLYIPSAVLIPNSEVREHLARLRDTADWYEGKLEADVQASQTA